MTPANPAVISRASFVTDTFTYDPLWASDTISQSVTIAPSLGVLKRGTVLMTTGALGTPPVMPLTTVVTGGNAFGILAQDTDTGTGSAVPAIVYTQGKFLDTSLVFSANGAKADVAALWQRGIYVLTVLQRSGILVPMTGLPATGGPMPQSLKPEEAAKLTKDEVEAITNAMRAYKPGDQSVPIAQRKPGEAAPDPPWATAAQEAPKETTVQTPPPPKHSK